MPWQHGDILWCHYHLGLVIGSLGAWNSTRCWNSKRIHDYSGMALATFHRTLERPACTGMIGVLKLHQTCPDMSREADEKSWRIPWIKRWIQRIHPRTQFPAFGLGFQALKASSINDVSSWPSRPVAQKRQVVIAACRVTLSFRTSISSRSTQGHFLNQQNSALRGNPEAHCSATNFRLMAPIFFFRMCGNWMPRCGLRRVNDDASMTRRSPPCFTISPTLDWNFTLGLSLWAHSMSSSTLQHSCSPAIGQRGVNLAGIAYSVFTFYNALYISLGLHMFSMFYVLWFQSNVIQSTAYVCVCVYTYIYIYMYTHVYTYTYIYI